jgi:hypothetical protein
VQHDRPDRSWWHRAVRSRSRGVTARARLQCCCRRDLGAHTYVNDRTRTVTVR